MFVSMLVFDVIIIYAMDVFDGFSPVKLNRTRIFTDYMQKTYGSKILTIVRLSAHDKVCVHLRPIIIQIINL